jgi:ABC-type sugar transport system ATPase subunit
LEAQPILRAERVHKRFGGVHALRGAGLVVHHGEVHALVGENGSGKSTLLKILDGRLKPDEGDLTGGERVATVSQETTLAPDLSIAENIFLGRRMARRARMIDWPATRRNAARALERLGLELDPALPVRRLRPDQAQMVEIARALSMDARVLILDEPTSSLTDDEVRALFEAVTRLREQGVATIFVSHRLNEVFAIADRITILRDGETVASGPAAQFDREKLIGLMVGRALAAAVATEHEAAGVVLRTRGLTLPGSFSEVDLEVAGGEIVGLAGLVGAGRTELLESLFGLHRPEGLVELDGRAVEYRTPREAIRDGVALVPADRKRQGLVLDRSVRENLLMASTSGMFRLRHPRASAHARRANARRRRRRQGRDLPAAL